jgi:serine/threonine protein kinase
MGEREMSSVEVGRSVAGYRIESVLGRGGMSVVYLAEQVALGRKVALKLLSPELAEDPDFRDRFEHESRLAASLDHPHVIPIYEAGEADGTLFIAMRYVPGTDLETFVRSHGPMDLKAAVEIARQVAGALDAAHQLRLVHRDVKPANILLAESSSGGHHAYLADFGLTKRRSSVAGKTKTGQFIGSIDYASPEQIEGKLLDGRSDQYSLAGAFYYCLTGHRPFERDSEVAVLYAHLKDKPPRPTALRSDLPRQVDDVVGKAMAKSASARYGTCSGVSDAIAEALRTDLERRGPLARLRSQLSRQLLLPAALAVVVVTAGLIWLVGGGGQKAPSSREAPVRQHRGVVEIDPSTNQVIGRASIPNALNVQLGEGFLWVVDPGRLYKVDPDSGATVAEFENSFKGVTVGYRAVWTFIDYQSPRDGLVRIDPRTNEVTDRIPGEYGDIYGIDTGYGAVWAANAQFGELLRVENKSRRIVERIPVESSESIPRAVAAGEGGVWVVDVSPAIVSRVDPSTNEVVATIPIEGANSVETGLGAVWVTTDHGQMVVLNPATNTPLATIEVGGANIGGIAIGAGSVWVVSPDDGTVARINPSSYEVEARIPVGKNAGFIAADDGHVWVAGEIRRTDRG